MNITEYIKRFGNNKLLPYNMNESDMLVLTALSYIDFSVVPEGFEKSMTLSDAISKILAFGLSERNIDFLRNLRESKRFSNIEIMGYRNEHNSVDTTLQFSVLTIKITDSLYFISYSGTDGTIVGWKEDFQFSYLPQTSAQKKALSYLEEAAD